MFINWAPHLVHDPHEVPQVALRDWLHVKDDARRFYYAMVAYVDWEIGLVVQALQEQGMWNNTVFVVHSDNGGCITKDSFSDHGGNNYPLKGGKNSNWEGGIRVNAFVSGGFVPEKVRGTKQSGLVAGWDWYATFAGLANVSPDDKKAAKAGLPPVESFNLWPLINGQVSASPREAIAIGDAAPDRMEAWVGGLIRGRYKLLVGRVGQAYHSPPTGPPADERDTLGGTMVKCGLEPKTGCLFDIYSDPEENVNLAENQPDRFREMLSHLEAVNKTVYNPHRGEQHDAACAYALNKYNGSMGPFITL